MKDEPTTQKQGARALNARAKRDTRGTCGHAIKGGAPCLRFRERALSYREASAHGTMYPVRVWCARCASGS